PFSRLRIAAQPQGEFGRASKLLPRCPDNPLGSSQQTRVLAGVGAESLTIGQPDAGTQEFAPFLLFPAGGRGDLRGQSVGGPFDRMTHGWTSRPLNGSAV